jgi:hypothetical protein
MTNNDKLFKLRRTLLQGITYLSLGSSGLADNSNTTDSHPLPQASGTAKPGDFDFLQGNWSIRHRRKKDVRDSKWDEFAGTARCWSLLGGRGSIEELSIPERDFFGIGLRLIETERKLWHDYWVNAASGLLSCPGQHGAFVDGVGTFLGTYEADGVKICVRGVWDQITDNTCRWHQSLSDDNGTTWKENWYMEWQRLQSQGIK